MLSFFGLFLKFWTQIEESLLKNIVFNFESSPRILGLMVYVTTLLPLVTMQVFSTLISPPILIYSWQDQQLQGWVWERETTPEAHCCSWDHRRQAPREDGVALVHMSGEAQRNSTGFHLCRVCSQLPRFPKSGCWHTSITASYLFMGKREVSFLHLEK